MTAPESSSSKRKPRLAKSKRRTAPPAERAEVTEKQAGPRRGLTRAAKADKSAGRRKAAPAEEAASPQPEPGNGAWWAF